jgi:hypothetical protein
VGKFFCFLFFCFFCFLFFFCSLAGKLLLVQVIYSEFIFKLCYVKFVFNIYLQPYQNIFLPIKNMRNNLKFYANMRLLKYRLFLLT